MVQFKMPINRKNNGSLSWHLKTSAGRYSSEKQTSVCLQQPAGPFLHLMENWLSSHKSTSSACTYHLQLETSNQTLPPQVTEKPLQPEGASVKTKLPDSSRIIIKEVDYAS